MNDGPLNSIDSNLAMNAISHAAEMVKHAMFSAIARYEEPSVIYRPRIFVDGNKWCALYGENLQDGVAGFGDSPSEAMAEFNKEWMKKI